MKKNTYQQQAGEKAGPTYETKQFLLALMVKAKINNNNRLNIIDAGAGLGRNSIYLSQNGFNVTAVEYDKGAITPLENNIQENYKSNNVRVVNSNILDYLRKQENHSVDALLDSGMSHYLTLDEKKEYFMLLRQKMTKDGLLSITHFSKEDNNAIGLSKEELQALLGEMVPLDNIHFDSWVDSISKTDHFAWKGLLVMPGGHCDEIQNIYRRIYELILERKITSIGQIHEYLNGQNMQGITSLVRNALVEQKIRNDEVVQADRTKATELGRKNTKREVIIDD